jgi:hypothetical protein
VTLHLAGMDFPKTETKSSLHGEVTVTLFQSAKHLPNSCAADMSLFEPRQWAATSTDKTYPDFWLSTLQLAGDTLAMQIGEQHGTFVGSKIPKNSGLWRNGSFRPS